MAEALQLGRYSVFAELASGGMATVYLGRMTGAAGFGRTVAIKRLHPHLARDPEFVSMFLDEARLAARVQHPNVVPTLDVVTTDNELFLVLEYVKGESLGGLVRASRAAGRSIPLPVVLSIAVGVLNGLHAAHEAKDEHGAALDIVHRDVSPQNVLVGADGVARVLDFGVAKASTRLQTTRDGQIKGKIAYMAPEQIAGNATRQSDVYAAGVVLWEALALQRLFTGENEAALLKAVIMPNVQPPSAFNPDVPADLDRIVMRALATDPIERFATAREMAEALDVCMRPASANQVASWLESLAGHALQARSKLVAEAEAHSGTTGRSEVRKLVDLGSGALLPGESGAHPQPTGGQPGSGTSLSVATLTLAGEVGSKAPPAPKSRGWILALAAALVAGALGGVAIVVTRDAHTDARLEAQRGANAAAPPAAGVPGTVPSTSAPPATSATTTQPAPPPSASANMAEPAPPSSTATAPAPPAPPVTAATPTVKNTNTSTPRPGPKKPDGPSKPKGPNGGNSSQGGDINSLLDSH
jgi:eukaryotic-like serine/threonine-protein kinase